jgi:glycine hydroxymethyltransferase
VKLNKKITINEAIDKAIFPGIQGGPHFNTILGIAVALKEAESPSFKKYIMQVVKNAKILADELKKLGWRIVSHGTDTHLFLVDVGEKGIGGKEAQEILEKNNIIVNKNTIPFEKGTPFNPSGIRIGTPFITSQGLKEKDMIKIAKKIDSVLRKLL